MTARLINRIYGKFREYAKSLFDERETFIASFNLLLDEVFTKKLLLKDGKISKKRPDLQIDKIYDSTEMQIKLLKYLQGTGDGKTRSEIASYFNVTERALSDRVQKFIHPGNHILGTNVQIEVKRRTNLYDSTAHPIFLALNLSEVYSLLSHLIKIDNSLSASALSADESIKNIIIDIISQLTGYAKNILRQAELDVDAYKTEEPRKFRNETEKNEYYTNMKIKHIYRMWIGGNKDYLEGSLQVNTGGGKQFIFYPSDNGMPIQLDWEEIDHILSDQYLI